MRPAPPNSARSRTSADGSGRSELLPWKVPRGRSARRWAEDTTLNTDDQQAFLGYLNNVTNKVVKHNVLINRIDAEVKGAMVNRDASHSLSRAVSHERRPLEPKRATKVHLGILSERLTGNEMVELNELVDGNLVHLTFYAKATNAGLRGAPFTMVKSPNATDISHDNQAIDLSPDVTRRCPPAFQHRRTVRRAAGKVKDPESTKKEESGSSSEDEISDRHEDWASDAQQHSTQHRCVHCELLPDQLKKVEQRVAKQNEKGAKVGTKTTGIARRFKGTNVIQATIGGQLGSEGSGNAAQSLLMDICSFRSSEKFIEGLSSSSRTFLVASIEHRFPGLLAGVFRQDDGSLPSATQSKPLKGRGHLAIASSVKPEAALSDNPLLSLDEFLDTVEPIPLEHEDATDGYRLSYTSTYKPGALGKRSATPWEQLFASWDPERKQKVPKFPFLLSILSSCPSRSPSTSSFESPKRGQTSGGLPSNEQQFRHTLGWSIAVLRSKHEPENFRIAPAEAFTLRDVLREKLKLECRANQLSLKRMRHLPSHLPKDIREQHEYLLRCTEQLVEFSEDLTKSLSDKLPLTASVLCSILLARFSGV